MKSGWRNGDPIHSEKPRGKSAYRRKSGRDPGLTPTEVHQKNQLMKQFCKLEGPAGNSDAYQTAWCRMFGARTGDHSGNLVGITRCDDSDCWCRQ